MAPTGQASRQRPQRTQSRAATPPLASEALTGFCMGQARSQAPQPTQRSDRRMRSGATAFPARVSRMTGQSRRQKARCPKTQVVSTASTATSSTTVSVVPMA